MRRDGKTISIIIIRASVNDPFRDTVVPASKNTIQIRERQKKILQKLKLNTFQKLKLMKEITARLILVKEICK